MRRLLDWMPGACVAAVVVGVLVVPGAARGGASIVVTTTADSGPGSLRAALAVANGDPGSDLISFAIPASDAGFNGQWFTIRVTGPLPQLLDGGTTIDGSTEAAFSGVVTSGPQIFLEGNQQSAGSAFNVESGSTTIEGLAIGGFPYQAILIQSPQFPPASALQGNVVRDDYIGVDPSGESADANGARYSGPGGALPGISIIGGVGTQVGGPSLADRNVISGNGREGVDIAGGSSGTVVEGNLIGTDASGIGLIGNGSYGIHVGDFVGSASGTSIVGNVIAGNARAGVHLADVSDSVVTGNEIRDNAQSGVLIENATRSSFGGNDISGNAAGGIVSNNASDTLIGGAGLGNVISGNAGVGVVVNGGAGTQVQGNEIGTDSAGASADANSGDGIQIGQGAAATLVGGVSVGTRNVISGNDGSGIVINGAPGTVVEGNNVGTDASGSAAIPNQVSGLTINAPNTTVGGATAAARNVISGNLVSGIAVNGGSDGTVIEGNYIGTDASGSAALGNALNTCGCDPHNVGVSVSGSFGQPSTITIGGSAAGAGNLISGNGGPAIGLLNTGNTQIAVEGNLLGTDASGSQSLGGGRLAVFANVNGAVIGGTSAAARNVIGSIFVGVGSHGTSISGNYIGTNAAGTALFASSGEAIGLAPGSSDTEIGGTTAGAGNLLASGKGWAAIVASPTVIGTVIRGNLIGTDASGTRPIASPFGTGTAILVQGSQSLIGGETAGAANTIAYNGGKGIEVDGGTRNTISGNSIFSNGGLGLDLNGDGVTPNDPGDLDQGSNNLQNYPVLTSASGSPARLQVAGTIDTPNPQMVTLEFFSNPQPVPGGDPTGYGEGAVYLGSTRPDQTGAFTATLPATSPGALISATATDSAGNTSEFAKDITTMPATSGQCKGGGWHAYGVFKNQGDCVSYVATGGRNAP